MEYLRENAGVDGGEGVSARERQRKHAEVSLQTRVDCEGAGCRIHTRHVLGVVYVLERQLGSVIPMAVVQVLPDQCVWLHGEVLVNLNTVQQVKNLFHIVHYNQFKFKFFYYCFQYLI